MASYATWTPRPGARTQHSTRLMVSRYSPDAAEGPAFEFLPNIQCTKIEHREGPHPPTASFRYIGDDSGRVDWPSRFEVMFATSPADTAEARKGKKSETYARYIVQPGDRIVVHKLAADDGGHEAVFDGFASAPQIDVSPAGERATFLAQGVASRLWDEPIHQVMMRDAGEPTDTSVVAKADDPGFNRMLPLRARFNPDRRELGMEFSVGNCTPDGQDIVPEGVSGTVGYPVLIEADPTDNAHQPRLWTLDAFARYLSAVHNDEKFVENPDFTIVKSLLRSRRPKGGGDTYDPGDPSTYDEDDLILPEIDATGHAWPEVLNQQLVRNGFAMVFRTDSEPGEANDLGLDRPRNYLELFRKDASAPIGHDLPYQEARSTLDTNKTRISGLSLTRDYGEVFNGVIVGSGLSLYEISVILAPGFEVLAADAAAADAIAYRLANLMGKSGEEWNKYRLWICAETRGAKITDVGGDRKYQQGAFNAATPLDFKKVWGGDGRDADHMRYRRPRSNLISQDARGLQRKSVLSLSKNYAGPVNAFWDGTGDWHDVESGGNWDLLDDRLGVRLVGADPQAFGIGFKTTGPAVGQAGIVKLVTATADPNAANPTLFLRLTTVVESDARTTKPLPRRTTSPLKHTRFRFVDARDDIRMEMVHKTSPYFEAAKSKGWLNDRGDAVAIRDDEAKADIYAFALQAALDTPPIAGTATIPWITTAYKVGHQVRSVSGRDCSLVVNQGSEQGEAKRYPFIVGVDLNFGDESESTVLHLSDRRGEPNVQFTGDL